MSRFHNAFQKQSWQESDRSLADSVFDTGSYVWDAHADQKFSGGDSGSVFYLERFDVESNQTYLFSHYFNSSKQGSAIRISGVESHLSGSGLSTVSRRLRRQPDCDGNTGPANLEELKFDIDTGDKVPVPEQASVVELPSGPLRLQ